MSGGGTVTPGSRILLRATKFDGSPHWIQPFTVVSDDGCLLVARYRARTPIFTSRGEFRSPYNSRAYFWRDRWYNVFRLARPGCELSLWYCNIATPAVVDCDQLTYADLDLDVIVRPEGAIKVQDRDDFERHRQLYAYPSDVAARAEEAACEVIALAKARAFPFGPGARSETSPRDRLLVDLGRCPVRMTPPTSSGEQDTA